MTNYKIINKFNQKGNGEKLCVFNINRKLVEFVSDDYYIQNKNNYIILDQKTKEILSYSNRQNIIQAIQTNGESKYYNVGIEPIQYIRNDYLNNESWLGSNLYHNPYGLWFGCGADWQHYINFPSSWSFSTHLYEIELSDSVKKISSVKELENFIDEFKNADSILSVTNVLNWDKIKEKYDGMVICPYLGDELWGPNANKMGFDGVPQAINEYVQKIGGDGWKDNILFLAEWYRHWETGSGVIWRDSGVKDFKLVERLTTFDNLNLEGFTQKSY